MSPPPPTPASEMRTKPRPTTQMAAPNNCHREYRVPRKIHVRIRTHAIVQQSNKVTLVIDEYWNASLTASTHLEISFNDSHKSIDELNYLVLENFHTLEHHFAVTFSPVLERHGNKKKFPFLSKEIHE